MASPYYVYRKDHKMKHKIALALSLLAMSLAGCNKADSNPSSSNDEVNSSVETSSSSEEAISSSEETISSSSSSSSVDEDDQIFNRDDGEALETKEVSPQYTVGTKTNSASYDYSSIYVNKPTNTLAEDFAFGVDCSSLYEVESDGTRFYGEDGQEEDVFKILKDGGANYARFRLWVDPYDKNGVSYGGGHNDISTDIYLAKRASAAGLKILIDFHYSDSWVDPSKKWSPKAWMYIKNGKPTINNRTQYKRVGDYTAHALNAFKNAGLTIDAVQIGNEVNNGMAGSDNAISKFFADMVKAGVETSKAIYPNVKTIVHLANVNNPSGVYKVYDNLKKREVDWDVCGLSYYPFWHGGRDNLQEVMNHCASEYGKEVMIVETSWGYTDTGASYCNNQFSSTKFNAAGGYLTSPQAQASELSEITDCLSKVPDSKGTGIFYWEPAWLPSANSGWISKTGYYYNDHGYDYTSASDLDSYTDSSCYSSWANQALFDYTGKALPSYKTYSLIQSGAQEKAEEELAPASVSFSATYNLSDKSDSIPTTGQVSTNLDRLKIVNIEWDEDELAALKALTVNDQGHHTIHGKLSNFDVTCDVLVIYNYIQDSSFENQKTLQGSNANEYAVTSPWNLTASNNGVRVESKGEGNRTGSKYFHWWASSAFNFTLSQKLSNIPAGTYSLSTYVLTHLKDEYGGYTKIALFYQIGDGEKVEVSMLDDCKGYGSGLVEWSISSITLTSDSDVTIGMVCEAGAQSWGHNDDWTFIRAS